ncbi:MAG TPA: RNA methyltransferase, partial [Flavobacteriaceae bacterium]|nr:RNA methyltransferase [Flavobacteriaceae bacterium]
MLSKSQIKLITSLRIKKHREKHNLFFAEGPKVVKELLESAFDAESIFATTSITGIAEEAITKISESELKKISDLKTPNKVLGVFSKPDSKELHLSGLTLILDNVSDPGNLGTIIRLCDWFGVENLVCSKETVDCYNPKVVQSTMGSLARVRVHYIDLPTFIEEQGKSKPVY